MSIAKLFNSFPGPERNMIRSAWDIMSPIPLGPRVFSFLVGRAAPYSGSIKAQIIELRPGYAKVALKERSALRNHLQSIHAVALANLAELAGNIALTYSLPDDARFIVTKMDIDYLKKARGEIFAIGECPIPETSERKEYLVDVKIVNQEGATLCQAKLHSLVGPKPKKVST